MRPHLIAAVLAFTLTTALTGTSAHAQSAPPPVAAIRPAPVAELVKAVDIPYESFTLPNGLRVLVHTDRKAPVVAVSVWYGVGSKNEPRGRTGFAHLYEHLMFYGSEHVKGPFFAPLVNAGATDFNGTTWFDRTNYFETVPTGALDTALMVESDRMGYLLPAMTQQRLDGQRAVVQNEKRQDDNSPYGLVEYEEFETLYPGGHPYHHTTIGSMADLNAASLADVKAWFTDHYGPNNAILVLAGDVDLATAREKVTHWFGEIPPGPKVLPVVAPVPTLPAPIARTIKDAVATTRIMRYWPTPGLDDPDYIPLSIGALVLGGLSSSRLDDELVRKRQLAVDASASADTFAQAGQFVVSADVKPGQDPALAAAALDAETARLVREGPTAAELARAATMFAADRIRGLESVGGFSGKAPTLAAGLLYSNDPAQYRVELERAAKLTPEEVRAVLAKWLTRPSFALTIAPGERTAGGELRGGDLALQPARPVPPPPAPNGALSPPADRSAIPPAGSIPSLNFPQIERATLSNGMKVYFARRSTVPVVSVRISFDAGFAADPADGSGTEALLLQLMDEGTQTLDSSALARAKEQLGARISGQSMPDWTSFQLDAVTPNLDPSLALLAEYVRHPALAPAELERVRAQQLAGIDAELKDPNEMGLRALYAVLYGPVHPYGKAPTGTGDPAVVAKLTRADLAAFHAAWLRPDRASIYVAGDTTLPEVTRLLERSFGNWKAPATPPPAKSYVAPVPVPQPRIIVVDRPGSPQSVILGGEVLDAVGTQDLVTLRSANDVLGGNVLSRINTDLRETKGWSYGAFSFVIDRVDRVAFRITAPVQTDETGPSIVELRKDIAAFLGPQGATPTELGWTTAGSARQLPGEFETSGAVLEGVQKIISYKRPDNYYDALPARYRAMTTAELDAAARNRIDPSKLVWVVVGDAAKIAPQLTAAGLPVEVRK